MSVDCRTPRLSMASVMWVRVSSILLTFVAVLIAGSVCAHGQNPTSSPANRQLCARWHKRIGASNDDSKNGHDSKKGSDPGDTPSHLPSSFDAQTFVEDFGSPAPTDPDGVSGLSEQEIVTAMECLLLLENDTSDANFFGPTWAGVSQFFAPAPVNVAALYYISYLYTGNWKHGSAVALRGLGADSSEGPLGLYVTRQEAVHKAYVSYRRWYQQVKSIGLARARQEKLDPLDGTGMWWY